MSRKENKKPAKWFIESTSNSGNEWIIPIEPTPFTIGRDKNCNLKLQSRRVSRRHAQINISGNMAWIRDLGSTNGTFLNQKSINEAEIITSGDIIQIGGNGFCVRKVDPSQISAGEKTDTLIYDKSDYLHGDIDSYEKNFRKMIKSRSVTPHFQPIFNLTDKTILGYEILGRVPKKHKLPLNPVELFNIALSLDMETDLSSLFREEGIKNGSRIPGYPDLFVNTHPIELSRMRKLEQSLEKVRIISPSNTIVLEISEKAITNSNEMKRLRSTLKSLKIGLAYDDFGVGQARLIELAEFPPDFLKFDISIIRNIHLAPKRLHQLVDTFLKMSHDFGISTIAEGVECEEEGETCRQLGFECVQGNFYGSPATVDML
jgi:EAL domain-containing protein (putative c-di-GMP-specific phosphodiesterase class I)